MMTLKQLFCRHVWIDDYFTFETVWPYTLSWKRVKRCVKCGRIKEG